MNLHVSQINGFHMSPADFAKANDRDTVVREMAENLVAGEKGGLDLSSDGDVIRYLMFHTPEQYSSGFVTTHMYAAIHVARETIAAAAEGLR